MNYELPTNTFYERQSKKAGIFFINLRETASFIDEHAVRTVRACAHRRPERSRRIYRGINADFELSCVYRISYVAG